jgi:nitrite reductase/ring-hydroxylating ferredoxin subunit
MRAATRIDLCSTAEVAPGNALKVDKAGLVLAVFNLDGEFFVTDDACTHGPGSFSEGSSRVRWSSAIFTMASSTSRLAKWWRRPA